MLHRQVWYNMVMEPQKQQRKQYDWLRGYQFQPGQSGNPGGRPKGSKSLKTFAKEYLENLPNEEKIEFLSALPEELVFRMAEGNPATNTDITSKGERILVMPPELINKNESDQKPSVDSAGQAQV